MYVCIYVCMYIFMHLCINLSPHLNAVLVEKASIMIHRLIPPHLQEYQEEPLAVLL